MPRHLLNEIGHFFDVYKELEPGKATDVRGWKDRAEAEQVIKAAFTRAGNPACRGEVRSFRVGRRARRCRF